MGYGLVLPGSGLAEERYLHRHLAGAHQLLGKELAESPVAFSSAQVRSGQPLRLPELPPSSWDFVVML